MYAVMELMWLPSGSGPFLGLGWLLFVGLAMVVWGRWMARRAAAGHEVRIWCRLHGFALPYPRRFVRGRVRLLPQAGVVEFRPYGREALRLACGGTVQQVSKVKWGGSGGVWGHREVDYLPVPEGGAVRIWVPTPHSRTLLAMLTTAPAVLASAPHAPARAGSPLWRFLGGEPVALFSNSRLMVAKNDSASALSQHCRVRPTECRMPNSSLRAANSVQVHWQPRSE
ncbi:hypothetical protein OHA61_39645 [Streptomyces sp. NBC_00885]|nr:hypothetical protein OHA61_00160 [Streptomyces sp. NBC_00885]WSY72126.1 hypothetical protein OHA61_39645 [Streptomyces sp. NBC_00885]